MASEEVKAFAHEWVEAWNSHDLDKIMSHYAEDVRLYSPVARKLLSEPTGVVIGKAALRDYFGKGLEAFPALCFVLKEIFQGTESLVLYYKNQSDTYTAEYMERNEAGEVTVIRAHYNQSP